MSSSVPTISATVLGGVPEFIRSNFGQKGLDFAFDVSGIPAGLQTLQTAFIPEISVVKFIDAAARLSGEHQLGLILSPYLSIDTYGVLADYIRGADTLGGGLARFLKLLPSHASNNVVKFRMHENSLKWIYKYAIAGARNYDHLLYGSVGSQINFIREYTGPGWVPDRIDLDIPKPRVTSLLEQIYPCPFHFDAPEYSMTFNRELLNLKRHRKIKPRLVTASDVMQSRFSPAPSDLYGVTKNIIKSQLQASKVNLDSAAKILGYSNRTLQRELDQLGLSFRDLTTCVRMDVANKLLKETDMSISDIAEELGYSSHSHFSRAYSNETKTPPSQYRARFRGH